MRIAVNEHDEPALAFWWSEGFVEILSEPGQGFRRLAIMPGRTLRA